MNDIIDSTAGKRKKLSIAAKPVIQKKRKIERGIKRLPVVRDDSPSYVSRDDAVFMVYNPDGYMPKKVYDNPGRACADAIKLAKEFGGKFHVMRTWRFMEAGSETNED